MKKRIQTLALLNTAELMVKLWLNIRTTVMRLLLSKQKSQPITVRLTFLSQLHLLLLRHTTVLSI